jgi:hypothetical protein
MFVIDLSCSTLHYPVMHNVTEAGLIIFRIKCPNAKSPLLLAATPMVVKNASGSLAKTAKPKKPDDIANNQFRNGCISSIIGAFIVLGRTL